MNSLKDPSELALTKLSLITYILLKYKGVWVNDPIYKLKMVLMFQTRQK